MAADIDAPVGRSRLAVATGLAVLALTGTAAALAWRSGSPLVPRGGGTASGGTAWTFLILVGAAFVAYLGALALLRRAPPRLGVVVAVAAAVQLVPLGAPLLLSTDAWTYWDYGRIAAVHGANPYADEPSRFPGDPALAAMGARWHDKTSVYGPVFTLASEPLARAAGSSRDAAAWEYKVIAALAALACAALAARASRRRALAAAFVGWNPVLAIHLAGGGHNDAWIGLLVLGGARARGVPPRQRLRRASGSPRSPSNGCRSSSSASASSRHGLAVSVSGSPAPAQRL